ncbi:MAG: nucleotidyltransferase domain-containing protein [Nitrospirae bacterium]|nr:nucleotidyltransferase domain-containing protein [Nitrospirota bacterium]
MLNTILNTLNLTKSERDALDEFLLGLRTDWPLAKFKLFGSKIKGIADAESDLDLLVLLPHRVTEEIRQKIVHRAFDVNLTYGSNISVLIVSEEEWENSPLSILPVHAIIEEEGIPL